MLYEVITIERPRWRPTIIVDYVTLLLPWDRLKFGANLSAVRLPASDCITTLCPLEARIEERIGIHGQE